MSCNCGCGGCQTKNQGPLLMEAKVKSLLSEGLTHHISNQIPLHETIYRYGSIKHLSLIKEARKLYSRNVIDLNEFDVELVKTNLGQWGLFEGEEVPLDLPMMNEELQMPTQDEVDKFFERTYNETHYLNSKPVAGQKGTFNKMEMEPWDEYDLSNWNALVRKDKEGRRPLSEGKFKVGQKVTYLGHPAVVTATKEYNGRDFVSVSYDKGTGKTKAQGILATSDSIKPLSEAKKKQKKDPPIGKPKRGGSKAYYVYVRDPKTKKVKKVSFGSGGLRAKINNPKARKAFAARHKCSQKTDRTKPSYWSCRLPRYAKALGLGNNKNTFW